MKLLYAIAFALSGMFPPLVTQGEQRLERFVLADQSLPDSHPWHQRRKHNDGKRHPNFRDRKVAA